MSEKYSVVFSGRVREGETPEAVRLRMAELFRVKPEQLEPFFRKGPSALRRGLDEATAVKWVTAVEKTGALCWAEPEQAEATAAVPVTTPRVSRPADVTPFPGQRIDPRPVADTSAVRPADEMVTPAPLASPSLLVVAEPIKPPQKLRRRADVVPFPKCPKCGRLPASVEDPFMQTGVCPQCGLIITKYASNFVAVEPGFFSETDRHWLAFWQSRLWPSYWRVTSCFCLALVTLPALLRVLSGSDAEVPAPSALAISGLILAGMALVLAVLCFYCFSLFRNSRRIFLIHTASSLGICAVLAVAGAIVSYLSRGVLASARMLGIGTLMNPVRAVGLTVMVFLLIVLYFGFVRLPAEKQRLEFLDSADYSTKVREAMSLAGPDFPNGSRIDKYRYYKYVYVEPTREVYSDLDRVLYHLLPDFSPAAFARQHGPEVNLLVFNAISFREELAREKVVSPEMRTKLSQLAGEWERSVAGHSLVRALDTGAPVNGQLVQSISRRN